MVRMHWLALVVLLMAASPPGGAGVPAPPGGAGVPAPEKLNLLMIISDQHRWDCLGEAGSTHDEYLEVYAGPQRRAVARGVRFSIDGLSIGRECALPATAKPRPHRPRCDRWS